MSSTGAVAATIERLRAEVADLHGELVRYGLVVWTAGNISARVPGADLLVIKPSGVPYDELSPANMVVCDLHGNVVEGDHQPSSDTATSAFVYRTMPDIGGVVHTHSTYATAWASRGEAIPCVLTMMADEFGGEIPIAPFARIGDEEIGRAIVETLRNHRSNAVLLQNHGVFTIGKTARDAVKAAVMCEDVARSVHIARQLGNPALIAAADIDALYDRYQNEYGQRPDELDRTGLTMTSLISAHDSRARSHDPEAAEIWFLTGSQSLYGEDTLRQVETQSRSVSERLVAAVQALPRWCGSRC